MKRISELFENVSVTEEFVKGQYIERYFEELNQEQEERILQRAMDKINKGGLETVIELEKREKRKKRLFSGKRLVVAVLVAVLLGTFSVSAQEGGLEKVKEVIETIRIKNSLAEKVHVSSEEEVEQVIVENIVTDEKTKSECNGVIVSVEQLVSDGEDAYVYLAVELSEELKMEQWENDDILYFRQNEIQIDDNAPQKLNFKLQRENDGQVYGIIYISLEKVEETSCRISLTLNNLDYAVYKGEGSARDIQRLVEGQWNLTWNLACEKIAKNYELKAVIDAHDGIVTTKEAIVSPLSVRITGTIECDDPTYSQVSCYIDNVILKDGTLEEYSSSYSQVDNGEYIMKCYFKRMIPIEDVIGVVVNGEYLYFN